ncbi:CD166 antigen homolog [Fundulus heteroclitus]|uniref:CD166 antigen homolog n=1 Tax=Fundulus heteroclitus TaxID=8078 RepID=UPI00165CDF83|nr:CD166 antigen homolog [Fundulus heteroclitus]
MEVTALCTQMLMNVFLLLSTLLGQSCTFQTPDFPIISPDKLQFFEYESFFISCGGNEDMNAWRVVRKLHEMSSTNKSEDCSIPAPSCRIDYTFQSHSGEYWCENDEGERSQALNISVTAGSVILEFTAQPVEEGSDVTLRCVNKNNEQTQIADFYKDGGLLKIIYENVRTLQKVSKSDEGFYKCSISRAEDSPESWLTVGGPGKG